MSLKQPAAVAFVYFDYEIRASQTALCVLSSVLRQLVTHLESIPSFIGESIKKHETPSIDEITRLLQLLVRTIGPVYIVVDALDECDALQRKCVLGTLQKLAEVESVRLFATARPHIEDIKTLFDPYPQLEIKADDGDLHAYMYHNIGLRGAYDIVNDEFAKFIVETLTERAHGK